MILLPVVAIVFIVGWILQYLGPSPESCKSVWGILTEQAKIGILEGQLAYAIIEEREGIMLGALGVFALTPFILFGGFPLWMYISAGFFTVLGGVAMAHGISRKNVIKLQLRRITNRVC